MTFRNFCRLLAVLPLVSVAACASGQPQAGVEVQAQTSPGGGAAPTYRERFRPQYHFTPPANWMNDPNGMVYYDGEYHLFYQHNPFGDKWGHMSWGHAVSPDLVHWEHLPVAIPEANGVMAFSGSAVVDWNNTSRFGRDGKPPLVAIYTGHRETNQSQYIAYSNNRGRTWTVYDGNPVLDIGRKDFRDPKVFWHEPRQRWVMVVALPDQHKVSFYSSPDLKQWRHLSDFGPAAAVGGIWECPDLFELPADGDPKDTRWVLIVSLNPGSISGGSGMQYFVGHFDGTRFIAESPGAGITGAGMPLDSVLWADYGRDFYAAVSWSDVPREDGRRIWLGWMNNWRYALDIPTSPWRSVQSLPRMLALRTTSQGVRMVQQPVSELQQLRGQRRTLAAQPIAEGSTSLARQGIAGTALEIVAEFEVGTAAELGLKVRTGEQEETVIGIDSRAGQLFVDRTRSGHVGFHPEFSGRHTAPLPVANGRVRLHVFVDWSSVEVFAASGEVVVTDQIFPAPESDGVALYAQGGTARLVSLDAWPLDSIWRTAAAGESRSTPSPNVASRETNALTVESEMIATTIVTPAEVATSANAARTGLVAHDRAQRTRNGPSQETGRTWFMSRSRRLVERGEALARDHRWRGYDAVQRLRAHLAGVHRGRDSAGDVQSVALGRHQSWREDVAGEPSRLRHSETRYTRHENRRKRKGADRR